MSHSEGDIHRTTRAESPLSLGSLMGRGSIWVSFPIQKLSRSQRVILNIPENLSQLALTQTLNPLSPPHS